MIGRGRFTLRYGLGFNGSVALTGTPVSNNEEFRITVAKQTLSRELRAMGYRKLSARIVPSLQG